MTEKEGFGELKEGKEESLHWADRAAEQVIKEKGDKKEYILAAGITPSGTVHIGNFREIITVDLVKRALEDKGKKVRFIYSWDDYDVFRKVPLNMPKPEVLKEYLRKPVGETPDTFGCHKNYAEHNEKMVEEVLPLVGIFPEFIYQHKKYQRGDYAKEIKKALEEKEKIKAILNKYRGEEKIDEKWLPVAIFCGKCGRDTIKEIKWLGGYELSYKCECGYEERFDFRKKGIVKLKWRVDWPMRWHYEKVDFEPGGKDHSTLGGSYDTGRQISKGVWDFEAPVYVRYDFVSIKGKGGKMSKSIGEVVTVKEVLEVYEPEVVRYLFAGTRPNAEFAISFDVDVLKNYEDFDKCERVYFGEEKVSEKEKKKQSRIYELSCVKKCPLRMPYQPGFRHLTTVLQIKGLDVEKAIGYFEKELKKEFDKERLKMRAECAKNWLEKYAPEEFRFRVQEEVKVKLEEKERKVLKTLRKRLGERDWTEKELHNEFYVLCQNEGLEAKDFFKAAYKVLIGKERGPRLAAFILEIGKEKVAELLGKV